MRPIALNRKNAPLRERRRRPAKLGLHRLADRDLQLNGVNPRAHFADALTRFVNLLRDARIDELMPWI